MCDGNDLDDETCQTQGYDLGTLACAADCHFDTTDCSEQPVCGNDLVQGNEDCDGVDLDGETIKTFSWTNGPPQDIVWDGTDDLGGGV